MRFFHSVFWGINTLGIDHGKLIQVINCRYGIPSVASQKAESGGITWQMLWGDTNWEIALWESLWPNPFGNWARDTGRSIITHMQEMQPGLVGCGGFWAAFIRLHGISTMLLSKYLFFSPLCQVTSFARLLNLHDINSACNSPCL